VLTPFVDAALAGLAAALGLALLIWLASLVRRDVSLVDRFWSLLIAAAATAFASVLPPHGDPRFTVMAVVLGLWAIRLAAYVTWRNWGHGEDRRYQAIRARNEPGFALKSVYLIFVLQGVLAWLVATPVLAALAHPVSWIAFDAIGAAIGLFGVAFEAIGDQQLASFKADPAHRGKVMDRGVWRYTRHPNYFGECCVWWGLFLMALPAGGWWSIVSPLLMTGLLLKVSGVALLEKDIGERRPEYRDYIRRTNAFFPGPPKKPSRV
jgi:steroid 5-alpha reductase family enzyme